MKFQISAIIAFFLVILIFSSCKKDKTYPETPEISFKDFNRYTNSQGIDDSVQLVISFTDGDGDIGLAEGDTNPPYDPSSVYYYNFYIKYFIKHNGTFEELPSLIPHDQRIPYIVNENKNKALSGDIVNKLDIFGYNFNYDTLRFECYIYDRAFHQSNIITTPEVILKTQ